jgi:hypothetical protein
MAKVYITEYNHIVHLLEGTTPIAAEPALVDQAPVTTTGASAQAAAFNLNTKLIRVHTDGIISFNVGSNPTASTNNRRMAANSTEYFGVQGGQTIALITNT